jgi:hypothetical protein
MSGPVRDVLDYYIGDSSSDRNSTRVDLSARDLHRRLTPIIRSVAVLNAENRPTPTVRIGQPLVIEVEIEPDGWLDSPVVGIGIDNLLGQRILTVHSPVGESGLSEVDGALIVRCEIPTSPLPPGDYLVKAAISKNRRVIDDVEKTYQFGVLDAAVHDDGRGFHAGVCVAASHWESRPVARQEVAK